MTKPIEFADADFAANAVKTTLPPSSRRVSHKDLMTASRYLSAARDKEQVAGNPARAREINQLLLACFLAAIRIEDIDLPPAVKP